MIDRTSDREPLGGLSKLIGLECALDPQVKNLDHCGPRLKALGAYRAYGICGYLCLGVHLQSALRISIERRNHAQEIDQLIQSPL